MFTADVKQQYNNNNNIIVSGTSVRRDRIVLQNAQGQEVSALLLLRLLCNINLHFSAAALRGCLLAVFLLGCCSNVSSPFVEFRISSESELSELESKNINGNSTYNMYFKLYLKL